MTYMPERNYGCRLITDGTLKGMRTVVMENKKLRITILVDKGSDIWEFLYKPLDIDFMWRSPLLLRDIRHFIPTSSTSYGAFFDYFEGGWQEILPSTGRSPEGDYKGAEFGLHGETTTLPWNFRIVEDSPEKVSIDFWVRLYRTPFYIEKRLSLMGDKPILIIEEKLVNEGYEEMFFSWGHHPTLGGAFLNENCTIDVSGGTVHVLGGLPLEHQRFETGTQFQWPFGKGKNGELIDLKRLPPGDDRSADMLYLSDLESGWVSITDQKRCVGFGLVWPLEVFRYLWIWQVCGGAFGYPFYGRTYNIALEPMSSKPGSGLLDAIRDQSALKLGAGESMTANLKAVVYEGQGQVKQIEQNGTIQWKL